MPDPIRTEALIAAGTAAAVMVAALLGLTQGLGAHPWWAVQTGVIGALGGAALYGAARVFGIGPRVLALVGAALLVASGLAAHFGKARFAASFAEDALAGRFWYFGWFAVAGSLTILLAALAMSILQRRGR